MDLNVNDGSTLLNDLVKNLILWLIIAVVLVSVFSNFGPRHQAMQKGRL